MEQKNYAVIRNSFFNSYKAFIDFIEMTQYQHSICAILILKNKTVNNNLSTINVVIRNNSNDDNVSNEFSSSVTLSTIEAGNLINDIRNDFKKNHHITCSIVNPILNIHTIQNYRFSLNIKLYNQNEYEEAINFNNKINSSKLKILTRN